ncbi:hypothetical protein ACJX0J_014813 [Zea mays]
MSGMHFMLTMLVVVQSNNKIQICANSLLNLEFNKKVFSAEIKRGLREPMLNNFSPIPYVTKIETNNINHQPPTTLNLQTQNTKTNVIHGQWDEGDLGAVV